MKGKGVIVILIFLVGVPFIVDLVLAITVNGKDMPAFAMTGFLLPWYLMAIPAYICYLIIAYTIRYIDRRSRNRKESQTENNE